MKITNSHCSKSSKLHHTVQFSIISNFKLGYFFKTIILFEILQTKTMRFGNTSNAKVLNDKTDFIQSKNMKFDYMGKTVSYDDGKLMCE